MSGNEKQIAMLWKKTAAITFETAKRLRNHNDYRSCVSRAYYAAYQAATAVCIAHRDAGDFPSGWNNPSHEQLPDLIAKNGDLSLSTRRSVCKMLYELRFLRETADYRMGRTINFETALTALIMCSAIFRKLEVEDDSK